MELNQTGSINSLLVSAIEARNMIIVNAFNGVTADADKSMDVETLFVTLQDKPPLLFLLTEKKDVTLEQTWVGKGAIDLLTRGMCSYAFAVKCTVVKGADPSNPLVNASGLISLEDVIAHLKDTFATCYRDASQDLINTFIGEDSDKRIAWLIAFEYLLHHAPPVATEGYTSG